MLNLQPSDKAKKLIKTSILLFSEHGFHNIGIDTIVREAKVSKSTLYKHFKSKEAMVEVSLYMNKELLKEQVDVIISQTTYSSVSEKLKQIYYLHADLESPYYLLLKAILELKGVYPSAFNMVAKYRTWLVNTIHLLITHAKPSADFEDAHLFLFIIDGGLTHLLNSSSSTERDMLLNYFIKKVCTT